MALNQPVFIDRKVDNLPRPVVEGVTWYVLGSCVLTEGPAAWWLVEHGLQAYLPLSRRWVTVRHTGKKAEIARPAFSRYLFVGCPANVGPWAIVNACDYVAGCLCDPFGNPKRVAPALIHSIMAKEAAGGYDDARYNPHRVVALFKVGDKVRLQSGPLEGRDVTVKRMPKRAGGSAIVDMLGTTVSVPLDMMAQITE